MQPQQQVPALAQFIPLLLVMVIFYFLLIRPQKKQEDARKAMLKQIKKNDEVVTSGGIHGVVLTVKDRTVTLRIDDNVKIEVDREAIARIAKVAG
ncbi:MAG: preprotein translocase subunit YajC [Omnitrophica WOR_2 bacterium GWF2_43_52]|nr:MAG: preprotein translocase subunit YajC [Omnitrophica WOR_2 bacterium GWC2_44_8]OGX21154.1 MAG: preprotein translocase subunit YajC [Omnitrophica WOR_2 bacterium GWF2_43_52]OGX54019.1 MAG: preprotein translocase subunit YajC [Omnitrophica WOR_2 bacterium RIFOXYC2_FULL_43_9]HAH19905.1 preprotein translocase subunit YajC [Candidatus Omnitrophota bacterium]HBG62895.1 preprotein translocase subunit YajC [Candidatus Omnitrophota bacterium]